MMAATGGDGATASADPVGFWASRLDDVGALKLPSDHTQTDQVCLVQCVSFGSFECGRHHL